MLELPSTQAELPPFHLNLLRAIRKDWLEDPSTRVFLRAWIFGYGAQTIPASLRLLALTALSSKQRSPVLFLRRLKAILTRGLGREGLALFLGVGLGLSRWLDTVLYRVLCTIRRRYSGELEGKKRYSRKISVISTSIATFCSTFLAFRLQHRSRAKGIPPLAGLPLVTLPDGDPAARALQASYESSTLDFTLFLLVRAMDTSIRAAYTKLQGESYALIRALAQKGDVLLFWLSSWRIMWVWFYKPWLLPSTYNKWIHSLARMDGDLLQLLRHARAGEWVYGQTPSIVAAQDLGPSICERLGYSGSLGDPAKIAAFPCEVVHGHLVNSASCEVNIIKRWLVAYIQSFSLYLPIHAIPLLLFSFRKSMKQPLTALSQVLAGSSRSSAFLATFVAAVWTGVCIGRTRIGPLIIPDQQRWDGGLAMLLGTFLGGWSVLIENRRRRGEMALFVAPRALYSVLEEVLPKTILTNRRATAIAERLVFSLSSAVIVTSAVYEPDHIRGVVRSITRLLVGNWH